MIYNVFIRIIKKKLRGDNLKLTSEQILKTLDTCYTKTLQGLPQMENCYELAEKYLTKYASQDEAIQQFIKWQVAKCSTSGFLTSLGGFVTLPIAIPANLTSVWYIQLRMIATIAIIAGFDPSDDEVQTLAYMCLTGASLSKICREAGIQLGSKLTITMLKKLPGSALIKINQAVGFRFVTKFGTKGIINLGKLVPVVGGFIGGGFDFIGTKVIAQRAVSVFMR